MVFSAIEIKAEIGTHTIFLSIKQKIPCLDEAMVTTPMGIEPMYMYLCFVLNRWKQPTAQL